MPDPYIGEIRPFAFSVVPRGWAACDGARLPIAQYQALYAVIGATYGGDSQSFYLPNLSGRVPVHVGNAIFLGQAGGQDVHVLTVDEIPQHTHVMQVSTLVPSEVSPQNNVPGSRREYYAPKTDGLMNPQTIANTGSSRPHDNMQPYIVVNFCIAIEGIFPSPN